jgi:glutamine transport system permease protein
MKLTGSAKIIAADTFQPFEVYALLLLLYAAMTWLVSLSAGALAPAFEQRPGLDALYRFHAARCAPAAAGPGRLRRPVRRDHRRRTRSSAWPGRCCAITACRCWRRSSALLAELLKNSPVLVQLFLVFFGLPVLLETDLTPVQAAFITLSGNTAAFVYVIAVSAIESVGRDQMETARVFGLNRWQTLRRVVAPQAMAFSLGPLAGLLVNQLQVTSLISVIGVIDLTKAGAILNLRTLKPFIVWTVIGLLYYLMARLISRACARAEQRLRAHGQWKGL